MCIYICTQPLFPDRPCSSFTEKFVNTLAWLFCFCRGEGAATCNTLMRILIYQAAKVSFA